MSTTSTISGQAIAEWVKIFPRTVTNSYTSSVTFMKQLTVIAISTVSFLKDIFPKDSFKVESFGGFKIRILKQNCNNDIAQFVSTSLVQAFDALDKQYLQRLALCFYNGEHRAENLIEYHIFEYTYNPAGVTIDVHTKTTATAHTSTRYTFDNIRDMTIHLIEACVLMAQTAKKMDLSANDISLRLYYNDDAPEDYQAPGFLPTPDSEDHLDGNVETVNPHWVETPYHRLKMHSFIRDLVPDIQEAIVSQTAPKLSHDNVHDFAPTEAEVSGRSVIEDGARSLPVRCICKNFDADSFDPKILIMCNYCTTYQHAICYGICRSDVSRVSRHCCAACHDKDPIKEPTDSTLVRLGDRQRESLSLLRRTLDWCSQVRAVSVSDLVERFHMTQFSAAKLMKILNYNGIVAEDPEADITTPRKIIPEDLKKMIQKHYQMAKYNIVDRLVRESLSQEQLDDPIGDVLGPLEKINLRNATVLGRVLEVDASKNTVKDATLKEYREAILLDQKNGDKLPLSGSHNPIQDIEDIRKQGVKRKSTSDRLSKTGVKTKKLRDTSK